MINNLIEIPEALLAKMLQGDPRCAIKKEARVRKIKCDPKGDIHPIGSEGRVIGSLYDQTQVMPECYYVKWDKTGLATANAHWKIEEIK